MKKISLLSAIILVFLIVSCEKDRKDPTGLSLEKVSGSVQKGPFLNGTAVTISELSPELIPTGKNYPSQIVDNTGAFEVQKVVLAYHYIELKADGFYFNEVSNGNSIAPLALYALSDLSLKSSLNVNVLSTLEKGRVIYLVSKGSGFSDAKKQAQSEILSLFEITRTGMTESELLDISKPGEDNAILIAVSSILQGYLPVSDLSELLANISTDIREDGVLNSRSLGTVLINNARAIKTARIRENLTGRYENLGISIQVPDFEKYISQFIANTDFEFTAFISYPPAGKYGLNILDKEKIDYPAGNYSMKAVLPAGSGLKVKIAGPNWYFPVFQENTGWEYSAYDAADQSRVFSSVRTGEIDFEMMLGGPPDSLNLNRIRITVFENDATAASWSKDINIK